MSRPYCSPVTLLASARVLNVRCLRFQCQVYGVTQGMGAHPCIPCSQRSITLLSTKQHMDSFPSTCLTWGPTIRPCSSIWCRQSYQLQQLLLEGVLFLWQEKNKGRSGWDFLREGGEGGIIVFRVHPTCMLQWCFHKWFEMALAIH